jgi:hypothetical protein
VTAATADGRHLPPWPGSLAPEDQVLDILGRSRFYFDVTATTLAKVDGWCMDLGEARASVAAVPAITEREELVDPRGSCLHHLEDAPIHLSARTL